MEYIRDIAAVIGCLSTIFSLIIACSKAARNGVLKFFERNTIDLVKTNEYQNEKIDKLNENLDDFIIESREARADLKQQLSNIKQITKDMLRQRIMSIYYDYRDTKILPIYVKEILDELYKDYKLEGGNSYIDKYYARMCNWEIDYSEDKK